MPTERLVELIPPRRRQHEPHPQQAAEHRQRPGHVVAVTDERERVPRQPAHAPLQRVDVGQRLAGMAVVGEPVDHRHTRRRRQLLDGGMGLRAADDHIDILAEHAAEVGDALPRRREARVVAQEEARAAQVHHRRLEAHARPQTRLLEHERHHAARQQGVATARVVFLFEITRDREHGLDLVGGQIFGNNQVSHETNDRCKVSGKGKAAATAAKPIGFRNVRPLREWPATDGRSLREPRRPRSSSPAADGSRGPACS